MRRALLALSISLTLGACDSDPGGPTTWHEVPESEITEEMRRHMQHAGTAAQKLGRVLLTNLQTAIAEEGPSYAIGFCNERAIPLTQEANTELGSSNGRSLRLGRTSFRLRNGDNTPPTWAADAVTRGDNRRHVFEGPNGALGFLLPIPTGGLCMSCHGPQDSLAPEVRDALANRYPDDQATGFAAGDLRGYFWAESN